MIGDIFQPTHLLFVLVIALLVLGPKRLPEVGRALGRGLRDFRKALSSDEINEAMIAEPSNAEPVLMVDDTWTTGTNARCGSRAQRGRCRSVGRGGDRSPRQPGLA